MKFIAIDTETTGTAEFCQLLQIGAVFVDTDKPESEWKTFERLISHERLTGQAFGLAMNQKLLYRIAKGEGYDVNSAMDEFARWFLRTASEFGTKRSVVMAAKNPNFDRSFLHMHPAFAALPISHRMIDVGNLYWDPAVDGDELPGSAIVMSRAGQVGEVAHTALEDAMSVARAVTRYVRDRMPVAAPLNPRVFPKGLGKSIPPEISGDGTGTALPPIPDREIFIEEAQSNWPGTSIYDASDFWILLENSTCFLLSVVHT